jgi:CBS domain-containing protein
MQLKDVMTRGVTVVPPEATVQDAARKMEQFDIGSLPVCDGERLVGMLTDRDIIVRAVAQRRDPATAAVHEVMTPEVAYCFEDQDVAEARRLMAERQLRRLPVLNRNKWLVGIVTLGDLAVDADDPRRAGETLKAVSEPAAGERRDWEWVRETERDRQGHGRGRPDSEWGRQRPGSAARWEQDWRREGYREESQKGHDWRSPSYKERQQNYPWGQQGQEGYFGELPRRHVGILEREGNRPDSGWERQSYGRGQQSWTRENLEYNPESRTYPWSPGWPTLDAPRGHWNEPQDQDRYDRREGTGASWGLHAGRGPRGYQRSDARIREDICDRLTDHPAIDASEVEVAVKGCEVTLNGTVESRAVKHLVETMAETVPGVRDIHNQLRVAGRQQGGGQTPATHQTENGRTTI